MFGDVPDKRVRVEEEGHRKAVVMPCLGCNLGRRTPLVVWVFHRGLNQRPGVEEEEYWVLESREW
jgi:RNase P subunit RPR2